MGSLSSSPSLVFLLLTTTTSLLIVPSSSRTSHQSFNLQPSQTGFRIGITHVDHGYNFTKLQLVQRSIHRSKRRLERFSAMATNPRGVQAPVHVGDGEFLMNFSIGTPVVPYLAAMDTGSDLIWTQCTPCTKCFDRPTPVFNPVQSSTFSNISCTSKLCKDMVFRSGSLHPQPQILCLHGSPDGPGQYVAVMNAIFSAQRSMTVFGTDLHSRRFLQLPKPVGVDFHALSVFGQAQTNAPSMSNQKRKTPEK